jgi:hypothetical protein
MDMQMHCFSLIFDMFCKFGKLVYEPINESVKRVVNFS